MKIAYVMNSANWGGMEWHVAFLAEGMAKKNHKIHVWCPEGAISEYLENLKIDVHKDVIKFDIDFSYIRRLANFLKKEKVEIVHAHELKAAVNALIAAHLAGVKIRITHTHTPISEWQVSPYKKIPTFAFYAIIVNLLSTYEIALTKSRMLVKIKEGILRKKLKVIDVPNGVKPENFVTTTQEKFQLRQQILYKHRISEKCFVVGCIGRLSEEKGHLILLDAFVDFLNSRKYKAENVHLLLAGGGSLAEQLQQKARNLGVDDKVTITGIFPPSDQKKYFSALDCFVHPSLAEGFGIVLVEAMMANMPVLASDLEVFHEVAGEMISYFDRGNATDLSQKMSNIIDNKELYKKKAEEAQEYAISHYAYTNFIDSYEQFYLELLKN